MPALTRSLKSNKKNNRQLFGLSPVFISEEDVLLVRQCLDGDKRAFEKIVDKYQKPIFNVTYRMLNSYDDAEDVTQSVFIKAFEKLETFNPKYKFFSWLYRIAINESLNFIEQKKRYEVLDEELALEEQAADETYIDSETKQTVQDALMHLEIEQRAAVILKHFQDLSYKEIGFIFDIPEKTVKSRLFSARQQLKNILLRKAL